MRKPKYHFLQLTQRPRGKFLFALPGQMLGRSPVLTYSMVKDKRGATCLHSVKSTGKDGDVFFTTTLKRGRGCYTVTDIHPLIGHGNVFFADVCEQYEKLIQSNQQTPANS